MYPTLARFSKASRRPLTTKRGNKDYYKGTRQAFLPGGRRTGAPGSFVKNTSYYKLDDRRVRVFLAPDQEDINTSPLKPYVSLKVPHIERKEKWEMFETRPRRGLSAGELYRVMKGPELALQMADATDVVKPTELPRWTKPLPEIAGPWFKTEPF